jgi:hypothetical protein
MIQMMIDHNPRNHPIMMVGEPGIGKTEGFKQAVALAGKSPEQAHIFQLSHLEPTDFAGVPALNLEERYADYLSHKMFKDIKPGDWVLVDEANRCKPDVQNAVMPFILNRKAGSIQLDWSVKLFTAANPPKRQNMVYPLNQALINRMTVVKVEASADDWLAWAVTAGIHPVVIGFIHHNRDALAPPFIANVDPTEFNPWASPRAYEGVSYTLYENNPKPVEEAKVFGVLGTKHGTDFITYQAIGQRLLDPNDLLDGRVRFPTDPDLIYISTYSVITTMVERIKKKSGLDGYTELSKFVQVVTDSANGWPGEVVGTIANVLTNSPFLRQVLRHAYKVKQDRSILEFLRSPYLIALRDDLTAEGV